MTPPTSLTEYRRKKIRDQEIRDRLARIGYRLATINALMAELKRMSSDSYTE